MTAVCAVEPMAMTRCPSLLKPDRRRRRWCVVLALAPLIQVGLLWTLVPSPPAVQAPPRQLALVAPMVRPPPPPAAPLPPPELQPLMPRPALPDLSAVVSAQGSLVLPSVPSLPEAAPPGAVAVDLSALQVGLGQQRADVPARRLQPPDLRRFYPQAARARGLGGSSRIRIAIDAQGRVSGVEVLASEPPGVFDQAARRVGAALRYEPARQGSRTLASSEILILRWEPLR